MLRWFIVLLNRLINLLKYPIAFLATLLTLELFVILYEIIILIYQNVVLYQEFFIGIVFYLLLWGLVFKEKKGRWLFTLEHELTHMIFALLTFHRINSFKVTDKEGGYIQYYGVGGGNWLITVAPYFFPTMSIAIIALIQVSQPQYYTVLIMLLGYSLMYHLHSTWHEIAPLQSDIQEVGLFFSWLFLPSANLFALIVILSAVPNDDIELLYFVNYLYDYCLSHIVEISHIVEFYLN